MLPGHAGENVRVQVDIKKHGAQGIWDEKLCMTPSKPCRDALE